MLTVDELKSSIKEALAEVQLAITIRESPIGLRDAKNEEALRMLYDAKRVYSALILFLELQEEGGGFDEFETHLMAEHSNDLVLQIQLHRLDPEYKYPIK